MKSNLRMRRLLDRLNINPDRILHSEITETPQLQFVNGCVFLAEEYAGSKVANSQFSDRTGYECFVNHVHFQTGRDKQALEEVFDYASAIRKALLSSSDGSFEIILSVADGGSILRFHKCRPGETWLSEDLESYEQEAILTVIVRAN